MGQVAAILLYFATTVYPPFWSRLSLLDGILKGRLPDGHHWYLGLAHVCVSIGVRHVRFWCGYADRKFTVCLTKSTNSWCSDHRCLVQLILLIVWLTISKALETPGV